MPFLGNELVHIILILVIAGFFYRKSRDWRLILGAFVSGFFIDIDHLFDYFLYFGFKFNLSDFLDVTTYMMPAEKIYVLFHGWEFVILLWLGSRWIEKQWKVENLKWVVLFSYLSHLIWDWIGVSTHLLAYSFVYRLLNNFSLISFRGF